MTQTGLREVIEDREVNALLGWLLVGFLVLSAGVSAASGSFIWAGFTLVVVVLALVPTVAFRALEVMLPWEVLALASLPVVGRTLVAGQTVAGFTFTGRVATYLAVAAVALIVAVELDVFTPVKMNYSFAILFVVVTTMAAAGVWAIVKWLSDLYLGTSLLFDGSPESVVETRLMWDFVAAMVAGLLAGGTFEFYFRRRSPTREQLRGEAGEG
jgi:hypothetical protein